MNINDIETVEKSENYWESIFARQKQLIEKYEVIEQDVMRCPAMFKNVNWESIDNPVTQFRVKDYLWRVTEEIAESYECYLNADDDEDVDVIHQMEEMSDSLHFIVELCIQLGISHDVLPGIDEIISLQKVSQSNWDQQSYYLEAFTNLGRCGNCLKNKPWKQSQIRTDEKYLLQCILQLINSIIGIFHSNEFEAEHIYNMYMKKSSVNKFRQKTNY